MRGYPILLAIAIIVLLIGIGVLASDVPPQTRFGTFDITPGSNHYVRFQVDLLTGGTMTVTFAVTSGTVDVWIMTDAQHSAFINTGVLNYIAADSGSSGTFSATLTAGGTYFLETGHGSGFENTDQTGTHTVVLGMWQSGPVYTAVATFVIAGILVAVGLWLRSRPEKAKGYPMPPPYIPAGYPPYTGYPPATGPAGPTLSPSAGMPPGTAPAAGPVAPMAAGTGMGMILVNVENRTATDQTVQLLVGGAPAVSLTIPAGRTGQAHLRTPATPAPGSPVHVEIVTASGGRGGQDVVVAADATAQLSLRIG